MKCIEQKKDKKKKKIRYEALTKLLRKEGQRQMNKSPPTAIYWPWEQLANLAAKGGIRLNLLLMIYVHVHFQQWNFLPVMSHLPLQPQNQKRKKVAVINHTFFGGGSFCYAKNSQLYN